MLYSPFWVYAHLGDAFPLLSATLMPTDKTSIFQRVRMFGERGVSYADGKLWENRTVAGKEEHLSLYDFCREYLQWVI